MTSIVYAEAAARRYGDRRAVTRAGARGRRVKVNWDYVAAIGAPRSTAPAPR